MWIDSWAWIEFFTGSQKGQRVQEILHNTTPKTSVLSVAEVGNWCMKNNKHPEFYLSAIRKASEIMLVDVEDAQRAGITLKKIRTLAPGMGMVDAVIYAQAVHADVRLVSGDPHFRNLPNVEFIE